MRIICSIFLPLFLIFFSQKTLACECEGISFWQTLTQSKYIVIAQITSIKNTEKTAGKVKILNQLKGNLNSKNLKFSHTECSKNLSKFSVGDSLILVPTYDATTKKFVLGSCHESILSIKNGVVSGYFSYSPNAEKFVQQLPLEKVISLVRDYLKGSYTANHPLFSHYIASPAFLANFPIPYTPQDFFEGNYWEYTMQRGSASGLGSKSQYRYNLKHTDTLHVKINTHSRYRDWGNGQSLIKDTNTITQDTLFHWGNNYYSNWYTNTAFDLTAFTQELAIRTDNMRLTPGSFLDLSWDKNYSITVLEKPYSNDDSMQIAFFETQNSGKQWAKQQTHTYKRVKADTNAFGRGIYEPYKYTLHTYQGNFIYSHGTTRIRTLYYIPDYDILFFDMFNISSGAMVPKKEETRE